jgi:hypothetical protein
MCYQIFYGHFCRGPPVTGHPDPLQLRHWPQASEWNDQCRSRGRNCRLKEVKNQRYRCVHGKIWRWESRSLRGVHRCDINLWSVDIVDGIWSIVVHRAWCWAKHIVEWSGVVLPWCQHGKGCGAAKCLGNIRSRFNAGNVAGDMVVGGVYRMISQFHGGSGVARVYEVGGTIWAQKARTL